MFFFCFKIGQWMKNTQKCLMTRILPAYQYSTFDCLMGEMLLSNAISTCMVDAGFCSLGRADEFNLERGLDTKGYPARLSEQFINYPLSGKVALLTEEYYISVKWFASLFVDANAMCYQRGLRPSPNLYEPYVSGREGLTMNLRTKNEL